MARAHSSLFPAFFLILLLLGTSAVVMTGAEEVTPCLFYNGNCETQKECDSKCISEGFLKGKCNAELRRDFLGQCLCQMPNGCPTIGD